MELHGGGYQSSTNAATRVGRDNNNPRGRGGGRGSSCGQRGGRGGGGGRSQGGTPTGVVCRLCGKDGHTVLRCYKRIDASFTSPPHKTAFSATTLYGVDTNRYMDSGATDHITGELEKLTVHDK
jgi:hypothetical protein